MILLQEQQQFVVSKIEQIWFSSGKELHNLMTRQLFLLLVTHSPNISTTPGRCFLKLVLGYSHWANGARNWVISIGEWVVFNHEKGAIWQSHFAVQKERAFTTIAQCSGKPLFFPVPVLTNFWSPRIFFVKTQRIRNKPSNFTNFLLYNQIILHKRGGNQSSGSTKSLHWLISFAACSLISG